MADKATVDKIRDVGLRHVFMLNILIACRERFGILLIIIKDVSFIRWDWLFLSVAG